MVKYKALKKRAFMETLSFYFELNIVIVTTVVYLITTSGTVMFLARRASSWSPTILSSSSQEYLSIRHTDSIGTFTLISSERQQPSLELAGRPLCSSDSSP